MKTINFKFLCLLVMIISSLISVSQESSPLEKRLTPKTIWDIPHKTAWEKWMWIHRSTVFVITKERPVTYDTAYIKSYYKRFVVTLPVSSRFLQFSLIDFKSGNKLTFAPNQQYNLGISISSRWVSFILNSGVKLFTGNSDIKGETKSQDIQLNLYGRKITTEMFFQNYKGFYIKNSRSYLNYLSDKPYEIREDVTAVNFGTSSYYIVNNKKFTYRNSIAFVEQQKKSAGSLLLGIYYSYFQAKGSPSLVTYPFNASFDTLSLIQSGYTHNFGVNLGYIYTFVFLKKCYATASLVQGIGGKKIVYTRNDESKYQQLLGGAGKLNVRLALGYDNGKYFVGTMGVFDYFLFRGDLNSTFDYTFGKIMVFTGYRFLILKKERKLLRRLKLIDY